MAHCATGFTKRV